MVYVLPSEAAFDLRVCAAYQNSSAELRRVVELFGSHLAIPLLAQHLEGVGEHMIDVLDADHLMKSKCLTAVISIDLNDLKRFNDENGHAAGDTALCTIVACIQNILPRGCHLYRTGGDEFMILCSRVSKDDVPALIDHMRRELSKTLYCCAIGFATPDADEDFEHICSIADAAMYANKKQLKGEDTIR